MIRYLREMWTMLSRITGTRETEFKDLAERVIPRLGGTAALPGGFSGAVEKLVGSLGRSRGQRGQMAIVSGASSSTLSVAGAVALRLDRTLYRVIPDALTGQYIGETEKNLATLLAGAGNESILLFFDEADALFGKRGDVPDTDEQQAYLETGYFLEQLEQSPAMALFGTRRPPELDDEQRKHFAAMAEVT
ncbi:MAG: AAA family ATPase [Dehalococcoidia bacterium]